MSKHEETFELIVRTVMSSQPVDDRVIRQHVQKYAQDAGISYDLARQAVILVVKDRISKKLESL